MIRFTLILLTAALCTPACMDAGADSSDDLATLQAALNEPVLDVDDPLSVPLGVRQRLRQMAAGEPCPFGGLIMAKYTPDPDAELEGSTLPTIAGSYGINAYNRHLDFVGTAEGIYGAGESEAHFDSLNGSTSGSFKATYESTTPTYGKFSGTWSVAIGNAWGTIGGLYHPVPNQPGGVGVGYWTHCQ